MVCAQETVVIARSVHSTAPACSDKLGEPTLASFLPSYHQQRADNSLLPTPTRVQVLHLPTQSIAEAILSPAALWSHHFLYLSIWREGFIQPINHPPLPRLVPSRLASLEPAACLQTDPPTKRPPLSVLNKVPKGLLSKNSIGAFHSGTSKSLQSCGTMKTIIPMGMTLTGGIPSPPATTHLLPHTVRILIVMRFYFPSRAVVLVFERAIQPAFS